MNQALTGELTSIRMPGSVVDSMRYDREGRLLWRNESGPQAGVLHAETMQYDARGKLEHVVDGGLDPRDASDQGLSAFHNWYSGLGTLVGNDWYNLSENVVRIAEELRTDPLGNTALRRTSVGADANLGEFPQFQNVYQTSTGRLIVDAPRAAGKPRHRLRSGQHPPLVRRGRQRYPHLPARRAARVRGRHGAGARGGDAQLLRRRRPTAGAAEDGAAPHHLQQPSGRGRLGGIPLRRTRSPGDGAHAHGRRPVQLRRVGVHPERHHLHLGRRPAAVGAQERERHVRDRPLAAT